MTQVAIVVGSKGRGSNMRALALGIERTKGLEVHSVLAPSESSPALLVAVELGLPIEVFDPHDEASLIAAASGAELVCLAGYMRKIPASFIQACKGKVLNIHPALLPKFGGQGMYGERVHRAVLEAGETESGCTVHWVTEGYDEGAVVLQKRCKVHPDDTPDSLAERVLKLEHEAYIEALRQVTSAGPEGGPIG